MIRPPNAQAGRNWYGDALHEHTNTLTQTRVNVSCLDYGHFGALDSKSRTDVHKVGAPDPPWPILMTRRDDVN